MSGIVKIVIFFSVVLVLSVERVSAEKFFLVGNLGVTPPGEIGIEKFFVRKIDNSRVYEVEAKKTYSKGLPISEFSNSSIVFDFPFVDGMELLSLNEYVLEIGYGIQSNSKIRKDFSFFRPKSFLNLLINHVERNRSSDNCSDFWLYARKMYEISQFHSDQIFGSSDRLRATSLSAAFVLLKLVRHSCNRGKIDPVLTAISNFLDRKRFHNLPSNQKLAVGKELSYAISQVNGDEDFKREIFLHGSSFLDKVLISVGELSGPSRVHSEIIQARSNFLQYQGDIVNAKRFIETYISTNSVNQNKTIKGTMLFDYFLLVSDAVVKSKYDVVHFGVLPSEGEFQNIEDSLAREWCFMFDIYRADQSIERRWRRESIRKAMRVQMAELEKSKFCEERSS